MLNFFNDLLQVVIDARFLWLPVILWLIFWKLWFYYIQSRFISKIDWIILEIKLPREIMKSPQAMEIVLNTFYQTYDGNIIDIYWKGWLRSWFSLEIASIGGKIHFFIYSQRFFKNLIEAQIYAQYPDVEITEVDDYTKTVFIDGFGKEWECWGTEFELNKEDAYPIKTYVDYGLHQTVTKEEQKTDPITSFLEFFGSLKEGEQVWFQILIRATKKKWVDESKKLVKKLIKEKEKIVKKENITVSMGGITQLTPGERIIIEAIERDVSKFGFDVGIRALYFARNDRFNAINQTSLASVMKQYNTLNLNGFKSVNSTAVSPPSLEYFFKKKKVERIKKKKMLDAFRCRSYFYMPYEHKSFVLNTEELATIFHFPGRVAETPTFERIEAKKGEAPTNLPV